MINDIVEDGRATVICSHRPALPTIFETLESYATAGQKPLLSEGAGLKPAEMMVLHLSTADSGKARKIVSIERYGVI